MTIPRALVLAMLGSILIGLSTSHAQEGPLARFPNTRDGIHVFNDQLDVHTLTAAQVAFAATHYAGAQKLTRSATAQLRSYNPNFVTLQYRLGLGVGFRVADAACNPTGDFLAIIVGDAWQQDWPGDAALPEDWFYHAAGQRVYWCDWGWYLMDTDHPGWRAWWLQNVTQQLLASEADGLFADSVSVPNFLGADSWRPPLPALDERFEAEWTRRINDWMSWADAALGERFVLVVNAGAWITTRDAVDYALADGVMIEGFAGWGQAERFALEDWQLQLDRILRLTGQDRLILLQSYGTTPAERLWVLANYLLVKGEHTYINLEASQGVEWYPEYDLPVGQPLSDAPSSVSDLCLPAGIYARDYTNALILVNPDPAGPAREIVLEAPLALVTGSTGGGEVPPGAELTGWGVVTETVSTVRLGPGEAAILLRSAPSALLAPSTPLPHADTAAETARVSAFHRSGQTFITWREEAGEPALTYRVYRHSAPFTPEVLASAPVAELPQGSGIFWTERARALEPPYDDSGYLSLRNYVITDDGPQLPDGTGLLVWTAHEQGTFYYTVTTSGGALLGTAGPLNEQVTDPAPVRVWRSADGLSQVYTQFMDYARYNPTYDAPRAGNGWLGLPEWEQLAQTNQHQQYAYNYWVGLPTENLCEGPVPAPLPLVLHLEGWGSRYAAPADALYWCVVHLWADDPNQSWYYGFSATHDYRRPDPPTTGPIVNYTEERLIRAVREVLRDPALPPVDTTRLYVYGHSMGGTGALMLAERYPQLFAAAAASQPMLNFAAAALWVEELEGKWGARTLNLPIENRGAEAALLRRYDGTGVWDWQNLGAQLATRREDEMAFIAIAHGTQDTVIDWQTVVQPAYAAFYTGRRGFIGEVLDVDHTWMGFREHPNWRFDRMDFRLDESFPALTYATGSLPMPPDGPGGYNLTLEWSSSSNNFAGPPLDTPDTWAVTLRSLAGDQRVDVTPRRLQHFEVQPGLAYRWTNRQEPDGEALQQGIATADADGVLVIAGVQVGENGNRLEIHAP